LARCYLEGCGWEVIAARCRVGRIEIDLIAKQEDVVAFVEVKLRRNKAFGSPLEALGWSKRRDLSRAAQAWVDRFSGQNNRFRFDVIGVTWAPGRVLLEHVEDAFRPDWR
jgi:putative endonuclease